MIFIGLVSILSSFVSAVCTNTPGFQCSDQTETDCNAVSGCSWNTLCSGTTYCTWVPDELCNPTDSGCYGQYRSARCWQYSTAVSCTIYNNRQDYCQDPSYGGFQGRCSWSASCQGTPSCSSLSESSCNSNPACDWDPDCTPESDSAFCDRLNMECGSVTANDNCEISRTVSNCGGCGSEETCQSGQCVCVPQDPCGTDNCGSKINNCGEDISCGSCSGEEVCISGTCSANLTGAYWQNMTAQTINNADLNDLVRLWAPGVSLTGENISYQIYKDIPWWFDKKVAQSSSAGFTTWRANQTGEFYFEAVLGSRTDAVESEKLNVLNTAQNANPVAKITGPEDRQIYFKGTDLTFTQESYDEDDEFTYEWDLGDGRNKTGNSISKNNWNFTESYSSAGQKDVVLTVRDNRGGVGRDKVSILILDDFSSNNQTLAYIDSPRWGISYGRTITLDASGSYSAGYTGGNVSCLAGNCPGATKNCPLNLECDNIDVIGGAPTEPNYDPLSFTWEVTNGFTEIETSITIPDIPTLSWSFDTPSVPSKPHKVKLTVNHVQ